MRAYNWLLVGASGALCSTTLLSSCGSSGDDGLFGGSSGDASLDQAAGGAAPDGASGAAPDGASGAATDGMSADAVTDGGGGTGGAGDASMCPDMDDDGETTCAGDCDDTNPTNWSGNSEACGDLVDNNCDGSGDEGCPQGVGTYVSELVGDDMNPGTQALPVASIRQGMTNAQTIQTLRGGGPVDVFVAEGHYGEKVILVEGVSLLGGHQCDTLSCTWTRDPTTYDAAILSNDGEGVLAGDSISRATRVDGFRIMGQDGGSFAPRGRAALTITGGSPTVANNRIFAPDVNQAGFLTGRTHGILSYGTSNSAEGPLIQSNEINYDPSGTVPAPQSAGEHSNGLTVERTGSTDVTVAEIRDNVVRAGTGRVSHGVALWGTASGTLVEGNDIAAGSASETAYGIAVGKEATINDNLINVGATPTCASTTQWCGGIRSESSTTTITNNVVIGADATQSVGVFLGEFEIPAGDVVLNSNTIDAAGRFGGTQSAAVVVSIGPCTTCGFNARVGKIRNNILIAGVAPLRVGLYEDAPAGRTQHPVALENNLFFATSSGSGSGALYRFFDGSNGTPLTTIAEVNNLASRVMGVVAGANLDGDPQLDASYHIAGGSPARGMATATEAPSTDMDGETRPQGSADIGADEVP